MILCRCRCATGRYDEAGNMIAMPQTTAPQFGLQATYDAWNRPTRFTWSNSDQEVQFRYDGLGRMVFRRELDARGFINEDRHYAWSHDWRLLEEHVRPSAEVDYRFDYIWGTRGLDDLIAREQYLPEEPVNKPSERLFALADATGNIRATAFGGASLAEFDYEPYGLFANTPTLGDWRHLFGGYYFDKSSGLYLVRNRVYHPQLGRWLQMDPLGLVAGLNSYEYCAGDPINLIDPTGEFVIPLIMLAIGLPSVFAARHGASEMEEAANKGDAARYASGQRWFGWGLFGTGLAVTLPLGLLGGTAATELGLTSGSFAFSVTSGAIGGSLEGTAFGGLISGVGAYSAGASGLETLGATGEGAFWGGVSGAGFGAAFGAVGYGFRRLFAPRAVAGELIEPKTAYKGIGVRAVKEGDWWLKSVDPDANRFFQWWGRKSLEAQFDALQRLRRAGLAPEAFFENGLLRVADVGTTLSSGYGIQGYFTRTFWRSWARGSWELGTVFNDIRPRNMGVSGLIFDPALDPPLRWLSRGLTVGAGAYIYYKLSR